MSAVEPGREISVRGERGRFVVRRVDAERGEITCWGGPTGREMWRTFRIDRVAVVHRVPKRRPE